MTIRLYIFLWREFLQCLFKQHLSMSPLALKWANDILCTKLLTLSPLAKVWMVISLLAMTCDFVRTHTLSHTCINGTHSIGFGDLWPLSLLRCHLQRIDLFSSLSFFFASPLSLFLDLFWPSLPFFSLFFNFYFLPFDMPFALVQFLHVDYVSLIYYRTLWLLKVSLLWLLVCVIAVHAQHTFGWLFACVYVRSEFCFVFSACMLIWICVSRIHECLMGIVSLLLTPRRTSLVSWFAESTESAMGSDRHTHTH